MIVSLISNEEIVDSFAGGGGAGLGIFRATGRHATLAVNHDPKSLEMYAANHPHTETVLEDVLRFNLQAALDGRPFGLLWASPDCKHFSRAKGGKPVDKNIRSLAWVVVKWAGQVKPKPRLIILENVREFADWGPVVPMWRCRACNWRGTEGQTKLARVRRRCPQCNSLRLTITEELIPDPSRKGLTFKRFVGRLKSLGYHVEWKSLNAADYGAPTHRRRLFLAARCDGKPVIWPEPTHGDPKKLSDTPLFSQLQPWRTAAECIDWTIPCPSIFDRKRPLAEATMRRIAQGIKRYVLENPKPFVVGVGGRMGQTEAAPVDRPSNTITAKNDRAIITPILVPLTHTGDDRANSVHDPLPTITTAHRGEMALISPTLIQTSYGERPGQLPRAPGLEKPLGTVVAGGIKHALVATTLVSLAHGDGKDGTWGESRASDLNAPLGTVHAGGNNFALVAAFVAKHFGGMVGVGIDTPLPTITSIATQNQIVAANLIHLNHGEKQWSGCDEPMRTVTSGNHAALVYSFLVRYFGTAIGQFLTEPLFTITGKDRFALVTVSIDGELYVIVDIGMRMLTPRELARAQGFGDDYVLTGTKTNQVARIGNSVPPQLAEAMVSANFIGGEVPT